MINLSVNIKEKEINYPIYINNNDLNKLKKSIFDEINHKNYIVIFSKKVHKLYSKVLDFPNEKTLVLSDGEHQKNNKNLSKILDFALSKIHISPGIAFTTRKSCNLSLRIAI